MDLRELGERGAIERLRKAMGDTDDLGLGIDDCAVYFLSDGSLLLASTDAIVGRTHMLPGVPPALLGSFAIEIAVSDVAAMGGRPFGVLAAMAMPPRTPIDWLERLSDGMAEAAHRHGITVLGGDTKASDEPMVAVTSLGSIEEGQCLYRRGAKPGDALLLTGPVGGPALGFNLPEGKAGITLEAARLVYGVRARVDAGLALARSGHAHACIDLSDGLAPAVHQLVGASGFGAVVDWASVPIVARLEQVAGARGLELEEVALHWGGEYELLAAVDPDRVHDVIADLLGLHLRPAVVGEVVEGHETILVCHGSRAALSPHGFDHFKGE